MKVWFDDLKVEVEQNETAQFGMLVEAKKMFFDS
jgi:hypothetical protein